MATLDQYPNEQPPPWTESIWFICKICKTCYQHEDQLINHKELSGHFLPHQIRKNKKRLKEAGKKLSPHSSSIHLNEGNFCQPKSVVSSQNNQTHTLKQGSTNVTQLIANVPSSDSGTCIDKSNGSVLEAMENDVSKDAGSQMLTVIRNRIEINGNPERLKDINNGNYSNNQMNTVHSVKKEPEPYVDPNDDDYVPSIDQLDEEPFLYISDIKTEPLDFQAFEHTTSNDCFYKEEHPSEYPSSASDVTNYTKKTSDSLFIVKVPNPINLNNNHSLLHENLFANDNGGFDRKSPPSLIDNHSCKSGAETNNYKQREQQCTTVTTNNYSRTISSTKANLSQYNNFTTAFSNNSELVAAKNEENHEILNNPLSKCCTGEPPTSFNGHFNTKDKESATIEINTPNKRKEVNISQDTNNAVIVNLESCNTEGSTAEPTGDNSSHDNNAPQHLDAINSFKDNNAGPSQDKNNEQLEINPSGGQPQDLLLNEERNKKEESSLTQNDTSTNASLLNNSNPNTNTNSVTPVDKNNVINTSLVPTNLIDHDYVKHNKKIPPSPNKEVPTDNSVESNRTSKSFVLQEPIKLSFSLNNNLDVTRNMQTEVGTHTSNQTEDKDPVMKPVCNTSNETSGNPLDNSSARTRKYKVKKRKRDWDKSTSKRTTKTARHKISNINVEFNSSKSIPVSNPLKTFMHRLHEKLQLKKLNIANRPEVKTKSKTVDKTQIIHSAPGAYPIKTKRKRNNKRYPPTECMTPERIDTSSNHPTTSTEVETRDNTLSPSLSGTSATAVNINQLVAIFSATAIAENNAARDNACLRLPEPETPQDASMDNGANLPGETNLNTNTSTLDNDPVNLLDSLMSTSKTKTKKPRKPRENKNTTTYRCSECGRSLKTLSALQKHSTCKHNLKLKLFDCPFCKKTFGAIEQKRQHVENCEKLFNIRKKKRKSKGKINSSPTTSSFINDLLNLPSTPVNRVTRNNAKAQNSEVRHTRSNSSPLIPVQKSMAKDMKIDKKPMVTLLTCQICGVACSSENQFKRHLRDHNRPNFMCKYCNSNFASKASLTKHLLSQHSKTRNYPVESETNVTNLSESEKHNAKP